MSSKRASFLNITGFKVDKLRITEAEFERAKEGKPILWLDNSAFHVWPSMNKGGGHICSFERRSPYYHKSELWRCL